MLHKNDRKSKVSKDINPSDFSPDSSTLEDFEERERKVRKRKYIKIAAVTLAFVLSVLAVVTINLRIGLFAKEEPDADIDPDIHILNSNARIILNSLSHFETPPTFEDCQLSKATIEVNGSDWHATFEYKRSEDDTPMKADVSGIIEE